MYIDLDRWVEVGVGEAVEARWRERSEVDFPVQEVLNPILSEVDGWTPIHPRYNAMTNWASVLAEEPDEDPVVVHYTGADKPWEYTTDRVHDDLWWTYLAQTPYSDYRPPDLTLLNRAVKVRQTVGRRTKGAVAERLEAYPELYDLVARVYRLVAG